jgi:hypothetical protein
MKKIDSYFSDFLSGIRLTQSQREDLITGHTTLRNRLRADEGLKDIYISDFLQGSYRRSTATRPLGEKRADVDVIVVTNLDRDKVTPEEAIGLFIPFMEKHYKGKYRLQGRSIGIQLSYVDLDVVITSAPSEVDQAILESKSVVSSLSLEDTSTGKYEWKLIKEWQEPDLLKSMDTQMLTEALKNLAEWKTEPLHIPDRDAGKWEETHPLEQIRWTRDKNKNTNTHYINVVKSFKWWRNDKLTDIKHPKGYPIEHMIGDNCPNNITSMAEGVCLTFEAIVTKYKVNRLTNTVPVLQDRGVPSHNVWKRITSSDFNSFYDKVEEYAKIAREAYDATSLRTQTEKWREIFGNKFPLAPEDENGNGSNTPQGGSGGFTKRTEDTTVKPARFA